jgi:hypothetical protein
VEGRARLAGEGEERSLEDKDRREDTREELGRCSLDRNSVDGLKYMYIIQKIEYEFIQSTGRRWII